MKIIINKKDIISWKVNDGSFEFKVRDKDQGEELEKIVLSQSNQQKIEDMHAKSGKFGGDCEPLA